jgi:hypothetical protein
MLVRSCSGLWIVKVEPKNPEAFVVVKSLGMCVMLMQLSIVASHRMTRRQTCV